MHSREIELFNLELSLNLQFAPYNVLLEIKSSNLEPFVTTSSQWAAAKIYDNIIMQGKLLLELARFSCDVYYPHIIYPNQDTFSKIKNINQIFSIPSEDHSANSESTGEKYYKQFRK